MKKLSFNVVLTVIVLICICFYFVNTKYSKHVHFMGEFDSTLVPTYSIAKYGTVYVTESMFKNLIPYLPNYFDNNSVMSFYVFSEKHKSLTEKKINEEKIENRIYPFYFPTYSFLSAIVFLVNDFIVKNICIGHLNFLNIPIYTNIILIFIICILIIFRLQASNVKKILLLLLFLSSPILIYLKWPTHDFGIITLFTISLILFFNNEYKKSFLIGAFTANMNPVIYSLLFGMLCVYLYRLYDNKKFIVSNIMGNLKELFCGAFAFILPIFLNFLFVYRATGRFAMSTVVSGFDGASPFPRSMAYLFDLNFGILPYYPIILIIFISLFFKAMYAKKTEYPLLFLVFFLSILIFGSFRHINCGMMAMHRYVAYLFPFMIFIIIFYYDKILISTKSFKIVNLAIVISVLISFSYTIPLFLGMYKGGDLYLQPVAKYVLNHKPELYNPLPATFNSRVNHVSGGYNISKIVIYIDDKKNEVRKLLLKKEFIPDNYVTCFQGDDRSISYLMSKFERIKDDNFHYINIPNNIHLSYNAEILNIAEELPLGYIIKTNESGKLIYYNNFSHDEKTHRWSLGSSSSIFFKADNSLESSKYIHINLSTYGNQNIKIYLNGENIFNGYNLSLGGNEIVIPINNKLINVGKINEIKFEHPYARKPDKGDTRIIAIAFHSLAFLEE